MKTNKELAVEVAIECIKANPSFAYGTNNGAVRKSLDLSSITSIIKSVNDTLNKIDESNNNL